MRVFLIGPFILCVAVTLFVGTENTFAQGPATAEALATFELKKIILAGKTLTVEIADTEERRSQGLMFRTNLPPDHGMLFIFENETSLSFWMKNTLIPLSIGYFDREKKLIDIQEMIPAIAGELRPKTYPSAKKAMYALEMPKGWYSLHKVTTGNKFSIVESPASGRRPGHGSGHGSSH